MPSTNLSHETTTEQSVEGAQTAKQRKGIALCLSGGGYRASLFHSGCLRRLNELGLLSQINEFSCVSGGSIIGGVLAHFFRTASITPGQPIPGLENALDEFRAFAQSDIRTLPFLARFKFWEGPGKAPRQLEAYYQRIVGKTLLSDIPKNPRFVFCGTNLYFANSWICEAERIGDYLSGYTSPPPMEWTLARAIAISSCFPPVFDPLPVSMVKSQWTTSNSLAETDMSPTSDVRRHMSLTDGGVYDNLGLEPVWKRCKTVLVSDGGQPMSYCAPLPGVRLFRYGEVVQNQTIALRKRWLIDTYERYQRGVEPDRNFNGAYWGISGAVSSYYPGEKRGYSKGLAHTVSTIRTDLNAFSMDEILVLEKHGYELADVAIKKHLPRNYPSNVPLRQWPPKVMNEVAVAKALSWSYSRWWSMFTRWQNQLR